MIICLDFSLPYSAPRRRPDFNVSFVLIWTAFISYILHTNVYNVWYISTHANTHNTHFLLYYFVFTGCCHISRCYCINWLFRNGVVRIYVSQTIMTNATRYSNLEWDDTFIQCKWNDVKYIVQGFTWWR